MTDGMRQILLAEHAALRQEQLKRMDHRVTLIVASLTVTASLVAVGLERESGPLLLITPVVAALFGLLHIYHHVAIREIGSYLRDRIEAPLSKEQESSWKGWHASRLPTRSRFRRLVGIWHLPILFVTLVPSILAIGLSYSFVTVDRVEGPLLTIDALLLAVYVGLYFKEGLEAG